MYIFYACHITVLPPVSFFDFFEKVPGFEKIIIVQRSSKEFLAHSAIFFYQIVIKEPILGAGYKNYF